MQQMLSIYISTATALLPDILGPLLLAWNKFSPSPWNPVISLTAFSEIVFPGEKCGYYRPD